MSNASHSAIAMALDDANVNVDPEGDEGYIAMFSNLHHTWIVVALLAVIVP